MRKTKVLTVRQLAAEFDLSRSTLLYYDQIGLLVPSQRSAANYRLYSEADRQRLKHICLYRELGVPLAEIQQLLDSQAHQGAAILERQLTRLQQERQKIEEQQQQILQLLQRQEWSTKNKLDKAAWTQMLQASGLDEDGMRRWHMEFEKRFPDEHATFLQSLGIGDEERQTIRAW